MGRKRRSNVHCWLWLGLLLSAGGSWIKAARGEMPRIWLARAVRECYKCSILYAAQDLTNG